MRKPDFCQGENKGADQLRSNCEADQCLCVCYTDSTISLLSKSKISSLWSFSVLVQLGLCRTWSETPKTGFLASWLIRSCIILIPECHLVWPGLGSIFLHSLFYMCSIFSCSLHEDRTIPRRSKTRL